MKILFVYSAVFCMVCSLSAMTIAERGKACIRIVVNAKAEKLEKMALDDLKQFLEQSTKAKFQVVPEEEAGKSGLPAIYLGSTKFAEKNGFPQSALKKEEWVCRNILRCLGTA